MSEMKISREHVLGFERARRVAEKWAAYAEKKYDSPSTLTRGETSDTYAFKRAGVSGLVTVTGECFEITAELGFMLRPFQSKIEAEMTKQLDAALAHEASKSA
jgi:putative polyhydroxyalkanoate system protein